MREAMLETYLVSRVTELGGLTAKMAIPGRRGWPDRLVILPGGRIALAELKRPKRGQFSAIQVATIARLEKLGVRIGQLRSAGAIDTFLAGLGNGPATLWQAGNGDDYD